MRKTALILILILIAVVLVCYFYFVLENQEEEGEEETELANPASIYCEEQGGVLDMRTFTDGVKGFCHFDDGTECEEWDFFRGDCQKGERACKDFCGDGVCQEVVCLAVGCPCSETPETCPEDCQ